MKKRTCIYREIADRINALRKINTITVQQVIDIADGKDTTESHPVIALIKAECRKEKLIP